MLKIDTIERTLGGWYKNAPHLPRTIRQWLADNIWWLALIGAVVSILGLLVVVPMLIGVITLSTNVPTNAAQLYSSTYPETYGGLTWLSLFLSLIGYIVTTILLAASISPLKHKHKQGWELLLWSYLINFILNVISALVVLNIPSLVMSIISAAIAGYLLFEIRSFFDGRLDIVKKIKKA